MVTMKFVVLLLFIVSCACYSKYCNICTNHILCQYSIPGPGTSCKEYNKNTFLTDDDIYDLVNQINERRNFIAMGFSKYLPSAANMKKLVWSEELATFAQRWVDQCDPFLRPDKEDQCRNLEHTNVGQNIASIINPSPSFNVKSFVEMWFIHLLDFRGSVTYYDQFQDRRSNYLTQLIWANTENVGCGIANFKIKNTTVIRIVCNFAPKGNLHGEPIYAIGYPATQCINQTTSDEKFKGLCTRRYATNPKLPTTSLPVSNLLRILNLSNDSVKQEIDPIYNNMKQTIQPRNEMEIPRHQIMRHIFRNKLQSKRTDAPNRQAMNFWEHPINISKNYMELYHNQKKERPRSDHSHLYVHKDQQQSKSSLNEDFRKYHSQTIHSKYNYGSLNNFKNQCTRTSKNHNTDCEYNSITPPTQNFYQCTRGLKTNRLMHLHTKIPVTNTIQLATAQELCPCILYSKTYPSTNTQGMYKLNCECANINGLTIRCPHLLRTLEDYTQNRNGELKSDTSLKDGKYNPDNEYEHEWLSNRGRKNRFQSKRSRDMLNNRSRNKRDFGDLSTLKPFWQIDSFSYDGNPQLKALRYTTLINRRHQKPKKNRSNSFTTETITIKLKDAKMKPITEKYLSFDELLHLRKISPSSHNARRKNEPQILRNSTEETKTTKESESTTLATEEYTTNTPFVRMKHCTRKLTCTWTGASMTDSNGSIVDGSPNRGSRTPPGYVEGCTRTSTCTRDYMNRNKFPPTTTGSTNDNDADDEANADSDYCERRSLNIQKRDNYISSKFQKRPQQILTNIDRSSIYNGKRLVDYKTSKKGNLRKKRNTIKNKCTSNNLSYGDLFYLVISKIRKEWEYKGMLHNQCFCNKANEISFYSYTVLIVFFSIIIKISGTFFLKI